ncbi:NAD kinase 2, mitochondrial-like [Physella acuta]|uniref:NAD kinase 2, mitochondrial-like n=1 Tax=Physella acuta TaxID=109671 RepID=UPI0027DCF3AC|nr:NAD kinase 2, mitochondrial-like [Physella acuta]
MRSATITRVLLVSKWKNYKTCSLSPAFSKNDFRLHMNWSTRSCSEVRCKSKYGLDVADSKNHGQRLRLSEDVEPVFQPKRAVILTKMTRFEYERKLCQSMTDNEFKEYLNSKDSDYVGLLDRHKNHYAALDIVRKELLNANIETRIVHRFDLVQSVVDWADVVFTAGGDGTYLLAANKFINTSKPLIGINTDPERSEGHLCLPKVDYPATKFASALKKLLAGDFGWKWRQRIQVTMSGRHINDEPIELHDQQLIFPEHRFTEHIAEDEQVRVLKQNSNETMLFPTRTLPCLALNECFIGESLSSRVSYYEFSTDTIAKEKQKSSGVTICTGTGSSSWHFHINHLSLCSVQKVLSIANEVSGANFPVRDQALTETVMNSFNRSLRFDPSEPHMAYTIRDPIRNAVFNVERTSGFAKKITIRSRMWDACLVIDGGMSFKFNDGAVATFEIAENNALRTVTLD